MLYHYTEIRCLFQLLIAFLYYLPNGTLPKGNKPSHRKAPFSSGRKEAVNDPLFRFFFGKSQCLQLEDLLAGNFSNGCFVYQLSIQVSGIVPKFLNHVPQCAWNDAWVKYGLVKYGAIYCTHADKNLVYGFSPAEKVDIPDLLTHGKPSCEFEWYGTDFKTEQEFYDLMKKKSEISHYTMKDFLYHSGHTLSALRRAFCLELGVPAAREIQEKALEEFEMLTSAEKREALYEESRLDFLAV